MMLEGEPKATPNLFRSINEERILGKLSPPRRERPTRKRESSLVTKTEGCPEGALGVFRGEGEVIADGPMCGI